jgi:hypothetical protein
MSQLMLLAATRPWPLIWSLVAAAVLLAVVGVLLLVQSSRN